jgi:hypothetical protein
MIYVSVKTAGYVGFLEVKAVESVRKTGSYDVRLFTRV